MADTQTEQIPDAGPNDLVPYLAIPYWVTPLLTGDPGDTGKVRPLPNEVVSYLCPSIRTSNYAPGTNLTVEVDVRNSGGGNTASIAYVSVWWIDPTTGFVGFKPENFVGMNTVLVPPRGEMATTLPMTKLIPSVAPNHICLLARVHHPQDFPGSVPDPINDRHWAQRNLCTVTAQPGLPLDFTFWAGNPFPESDKFQFRIQPVTGDALHQLSRAVRVDPIVIEARVELREAEKLLVREGGAKPIRANTISLSAGERRPLQVRMLLAAVPAENQVAFFEILQYQHAGERLVGSIGLVVQGRSACRC